MSGEDLHLIVFRLNEFELALPVLSIVEVLLADGIVELPGAPSGVEGVIEHQGQAIAVVDLARRWNLEPRPELARHVLVVGGERHRVGLLVDGAREVLRTPAASMLPTPRLPAGPPASLLRGLIQRGDRRILVIAPESLFDPQFFLDAEGLESLLELPGAASRAVREDVSGPSLREDTMRKEA